jgi:hypothetical protein
MFSLNQSWFDGASYNSQEIVLRQAEGMHYSLTMNLVLAS